MTREADFSGIIGETTGLIGDGIRFIALFVLVIGGLNAAGLVLGLINPAENSVGVNMGFMVNGDAGIGAAGYQLLVGIVTIVASYFLAAQFLDIRGMLHSRETRIWAYVGLSVLSVLGMIVGFVLLIVPGIILLVRWSAATGYLIGGRQGIVESLTASWHATSGRGWSIFGAGFVLLIGLFIIGGIVGGLAFLVTSPLGIAIATSFADAIGNAAGIAFGIAVYCLVADDTDATSEVFE